MTDTDQIKLTLRLPAELHAQLVKLADEHMRSLNSEVIMILRNALTQYQASSNGTLGQ